MSKIINVIDTPTGDVGRKADIVLGRRYTDEQVGFWKELWESKDPRWSYKAHLQAINRISMTPYLDMILD